MSKQIQVGKQMPVFIVIIYFKDVSESLKTSNWSVWSKKEHPLGLKCESWFVLRLIVSAIT